jgi:hypothetical protein
VKGWIAFSILGAFALGYAARQFLTEWKPSAPVVPEPAGEWTAGEYAGVANAYHVRPIT